MERQPDARSWVHPAVEARPSPIAGTGLFATAPLPRGTVVWRLGGRLVSDDGLARALAAAERTSAYVDSVAVEDGTHLLLPPGELVHFGNHSCDPSLWYVDPLSFAARRDVAAGEELTSDYGTTSAALGGWSMTCGCGTPACRGVVTGDDWRRPELQLRYGQHWTPVLRRLIAAG